MLNKLRTGVEIDGKLTKKCNLHILSIDEKYTKLSITITEGRNRQVRRMFEALGYAVQKLDRVYYAGITKKNLKRGQWRFLTREEVDRLKSGRYE